jgi:hypothetical protein
MKTIRSLMTLVGFSVMLFTLGVTGAQAQGLTMTNVGGKFTLPLETQWGPAALPAGDYILHFGYAPSGLPVVEVRGTAKGSPHVFIFAQAADLASGAHSAIICFREGSTLIVRSLEMPTTGQSASFALPGSAKLVAQNGKHNRYVQLAQAPMLIERIPVATSAK